MWDDAGSSTAGAEVEWIFLLSLFGAPFVAALVLSEVQCVNCIFSSSTCLPSRMGCDREWDAMGGALPACNGTFCSSHLVLDGEPC